MGMIWLLPFDSITLPIPFPLDGKLDRPILVAIGMLWFLTLVAVTGDARPRLRLTGIHIVAVLFFLTACVAPLLNVEALVNVGEFDLVLKKLSLLASYIVLFFIVSSTVRPREIPRFVNLMLGLACIAAIGTAVEYRFEFNPFYSWSAQLPLLSVALPSDLYALDSIGRLSVYGPTGHPLETATLLGMALPFAIVPTLIGSVRRDKLVHAALAAVLLAGALATQRKTAVLAPIAGFVLISCYLPRQLLRLALPLLLAFFIVIHTLAPRAIGSLLYQLKPSQFSGVLSTRDRASDYQGVTPDITAHPVFGRGYKSYDPVKYRILDNEYLGLIVGVGFVGLAAYILLLASTLFAAHKLIRTGDPDRAPPALAVAASVAVLATATGFFDVLSFPHIPYLFFFLAGLLVVSSRGERAQRPNVDSAAA